MKKFSLFLLLSIFSFSGSYAQEKVLPEIADQYFLSVFESYYQQAIKSADPADVICFVSMGMIFAETPTTKKFIEDKMKELKIYLGKNGKKIEEEWSVFKKKCSIEMLNGMYETMIPRSQEVIASMKKLIKTGACVVFISPGFSEMTSLVTKKLADQGIVFHVIRNDLISLKETMPDKSSRVISSYDHGILFIHDENLYTKFVYDLVTGAPLMQA